MPKILLFDIEIAPIKAYLYNVWNVNVPHQQVISDTHLLSFSAKWHDSNEIIYESQENEKDVINDKKLCKKLHKLMEEADYLVTFNGDKFDIPVANARFVYHRLDSIKRNSIDVFKIAKNRFRFTYRSLKYLCKFLGVEHQKEDHPDFPGLALFIACAEGNREAWKVMRKYNPGDIMALEDCWKILDAWAPTINMNLHLDEGMDFLCVCCSTKYIKNGVNYKKTGFYQRYQCAKCKKAYENGKNLLNKKGLFR